MVWVVLKKKHIYGKFNSKEKAINYMLDLWFDGIDGIKVVKMTISQYKQLCYQIKERG